jgi:multiple sugar transport system substrate-binding protein
MKRYRFGTFLFLILLLVSFSTAGFCAGQFNWKQAAGETVNVYSPNWAFTQIIQEKQPEFEKLTGIKVKVQSFADDQLAKKLMVEMVARSSMVDVMYTRPWNEGRKYYNAGWYEPLDKYLKNRKLTNPDYDAKDFYGWANQTSTVNKHTVGITINASTYLLFYRKDLFEKYGVKVPKTMDELEEAAKKLTLDTNGDGKIDIYGITIRGKAGQTESIWGNFLRNMGGTWLDKKRRPAFNSNAGVKSLRYFGDLIKNYGPPGSQNYGWPEVSAVFMEGKAAMVIDASTNNANITNPEKSKIANKVEAVVVPAGPAGSYPTVNGWTLNMSPYSKHKKAAWLYMQWVTSKDIYNIALQRGFPIARISSWNQAGIRNAVVNPSWYDASVESFKIGGYWIIPDVVAGAEVRQEIGLAVSAALEGKDPKTVLDNAAKSVANIMKKTEGK